MVTRKLNSIRDWIGRLGGTVLAAKAYGISAQAVSNWLAAGVIPWRRYARTVVLAKRHHVEVRSAWFEQTKMAGKRGKHAGGKGRADGSRQGAAR